MSGARVVGILLACGAVAAAMGYLRFDGVNIAVVVVGVAVLGTVLGHRELGIDLAWPQLPDEQRGGYRHEVSQLSWSLTNRDGRIAEPGMRQLRAVAADRLALAGIDAEDDDAVRAALGERAWRTLRAPATESPTVRALDSCLTALDTLEGAAHES